MRGVERGSIRRAEGISAEKRFLFGEGFDMLSCVRRR